MADSVAILCAAALTGIVGELSRRALLGRRMTRSLRSAFTTVADSSTP